MKSSRSHATRTPVTRRKPATAARTLPSRSLHQRATEDVWATIARIEAGFPFARLERFERASGIDAETTARCLDLPPRTRARRKASGRLSDIESERLLRLERLFGLALQLFEGDAPEARRWLSRPKRALGQRIPLELARTEPGAREVENLIGRLEHGVFT